MGLAGGNTPRPIYQRLAEPPHRDRIRWERLQLYFGDERCVPPDHPDSNYQMVKSSLVSRVPLADRQVHRMEADRPDLDASAREYDAGLPPRLDLLVLGMGADGHTASLFPRSPALEERARRVVPVRIVGQPTPRLTITPPVIDRASAIAVLVFGAEKAAMLAQVLEGEVAPRDRPIQLARSATWFVDRAAAARLTAR
jgi:6-phosphogluconolactonase